MDKPSYTLGPFRSSVNDEDSQLNVFVSNKHFQIELKASNFEKSPTLLADYLQHLEHLEPDYLPSPDEEFDWEDPLEELAEWVELETYSKIQSRLTSKPLNTSRLLGIVRIPSSGRIVGLLLSYIESREGKTLLCIGKDPQYVSMSQKWLSQITQSIEGLHSCGAVWGDAKPDNVLIDAQYDAYLIDFGGGYTRGWVDKELSNTAEGDLQGLQRISEFLFG
ncbi:hypothetical protein N7468_007748 [Penicillium chermesinum]|uniref:Protein kinase domain-containing protein n=1 Tax=Penicillium chermesinum TaxID=63820 RepID=A0A9W9NX04_9EURO|nr:uncharacterized protein N7468_007748 [Penicillium chermesinum]KAJ5226523.1 hypothetical protein N7468_007748 [Penicillium chermesinum]KAJ6160300.1 hypothetical protein N7470_003696 [Penicillium chermesinum]